ncbi:MAG: DUF4268 domain-containing protein [Crocinitomicaceae bacterium]
MIDKEVAKTLRIEFWSHLENQLKKIRNPHGSKVNWMNYNTGVRHLYFRMEADEEGSRLCIDLQFKDPDIRALYYEQFEELSDQLEKRFKNLEWHPQWEHWNGKTISRLAIEKKGCSLYNKDDWDKMHLFLKINFKKLDEFWDEFGEVFKNLD